MLGIPVLSILAASSSSAVVGYYLRTARGGRELYAIGSDPEAAVLYGLPVRRRRLRRLRPLRRARRARRGRPRRPLLGTVTLGRRASGIELQAVAAVVIGGVAIFGGSGSVCGAAIGAFLLVTINAALPILGIPEFWQQAPSSAR